MILWILLFILVVAIAFILAFRSMKDFQQIPFSSDEYSLFLIRNTSALDKNILSLIHEQLVNSNFIISLERLIKGHQSALVLFGPVKFLDKFKNALNLLELEDYTKVNWEEISAWEVAVKKHGQISLENGKIWQNLPQFLDSEKLFWQLILKGKKGKLNQPKFQTQIRVIISSEDASKRKEVSDIFLKDLKSRNLLKVPKSFSDAQILDFYKKRSFTKSDSSLLSISEVLYLASL